MSHITRIWAAQRLDSRGKPTVQVWLTTAHGTFSAIVPSGASKGDYEAVELRDGNKDAFNGNGVTKAVANVNQLLGPRLIEQKFDVARDLKKIDRFMCNLDASEAKGNLGANAILGISMACCRAGAAAQRVPLYEFLANEAIAGMGKQTAYVMPVPFFNVLNGGVHSGNSMAFQEFMIAPTGATSMAHAVQIGAEVYTQLKSTITTKYGKAATGIGDEGGFAPPISEPHEALDLLMEAIKAAGHEHQVKIGIDPASSEFLTSDGKYNMGMKWDRPKELSSSEMIDLYHSLLERYPIVLLEDPFAQDDWQAWTSFNASCPVELVGDDLLATNLKRINRANDEKACNSLLLKINQIGTISEAITATLRAYELSWAVFVSHRSGETTDDFIADLTVALGTGHLKSGSPCRGERVAKYNRLMDIEDEIRAKAGESGCRYAGTAFRSSGR